MPLNNPFIKTNSMDSDLATAKLFEHAVQTDLAKINRDWANVPALTDGKRMYINSDEVLEKIMPGYKKHPVETLELLLHHENLHMELKHHKRYFKMVKELQDLYERGELESYNLTHSEVNIIMDILVHDVLFHKREGLTEIGIENLAQMRDRNSLRFTFKGKNLEDMLEEYARFKKGDEGEGDGDGDSKEGKDGEDKDGEGEGLGDSKSDDDSKEDEDKDSKSKNTDTKDTKEDSKDEGGTKGHSDSGKGGEDPKTPKKNTEPKLEEKEDTEKDKDEEEDKGHHDETDWSKLDERGEDEFITEADADKIDRAIEKLRRMKVSLSNLTRTLNGLVTDKRERTYTMPCYTALQGTDLIFKGHRRARASLYLIFDASGSMGTELATFKKIIKDSIPQAMNSPCEWFAGDYARIAPYDDSHYQGGYYKGTFKDIMPVVASSGFNDDGDRVIALCEQAESKGFTPIGVTDGGGGISNVTALKKLKKTIFVGTSSRWLELAKKMNPSIQTLCIFDEDSDY